jgi:hypothetical protein
VGGGNIEMDILFQKKFEQRKELLFSIQVGSVTDKDRRDAWNILEVGVNGGGGGFFDIEQNTYAKNLMESHMNSTQIEKLVIWETIRTRMIFSPNNPKRGNGYPEERLKLEMAKLLFSALGIDKQELFDAENYKARNVSEEASIKGNLAEEEISKLQIEQTPVAEQILERHWKLDP